MSMYITDVNAWKGVFGDNGSKKRLCAWHVDRAWREVLKKHIDTKASRVEIYHHLRVLLMQNEEPSFRVLLQQFLTYLEDAENRFYLYFKTEYCNRLETWASCYQVGTTVNTNMFVEAFHRLLKVVYLQHKQNRRVDVLLNTLLKIARDKTFEMLLKQEKGKNTHRICEINKRHKAAQLMLSNPRISTVGNLVWEVCSQTRAEVTYRVQQHQKHCDCKLRCKSCSGCVHMYSCTCLDASLHATVCKHMHLVHMTTYFYSYYTY